MNWFLKNSKPKEQLEPGDSPDARKKLRIYKRRQTLGRVVGKILQGFSSAFPAPQYFPDDKK